MEYVVKGFLGLFKRVAYKCPSCTNELESRMSEAGRTDSCPLCGAQFVVPGAEEKLRKEAEEKKRREAEETMKAERLAAFQKAQQKAAIEAKKLEESDREAYDALVEPTGGYVEGPGEFAIEAVGESHYQAALEALIHDHGKMVEAVLILEDANPYDSSAVQVQIEDCVCGYLSRDDARAYRRQLKKSGHPRVTLRCRAVIVGDGPYGLRLDLPHDGPAKNHDAWRDEPATDRQKEYADDLGVKYHKRITKGELADRISEAKGGE